MSLPHLPILLVAHRGFAEGLLQAAEAILGERPEVDHLSNEGISPQLLDDRIQDWLRNHPGPSLILTDVGFGSCCQSARRAARHREDTAVVTGVNLPVLLAAIRSREHGELGPFLRHLEERGRGGIEVFTGGTRA